MRRTMIWTVSAVAAVVAAPVGAQNRDNRPAATDRTREGQPDRELRESRYQIGQTERVLEGAVEHGATVIRDRLQAVMPADMLLTENARARGFRLEGYGVFFDVEVPSLEGTLPWSFRTLDRSNLGLDSALTTVRAFVQATASNDVNLQQALKRIELQVAPSGAPASVQAVPASGSRVVDVATTQASASDQADSILANPNESYRAAIRSALIDAMLEHSRGLNIGPNEWLTVAARSSDDRPRLAPADTDNRTVMISVRGADLAAFLGGQITRAEALARVEVRVF